MPTPPKSENFIAPPGADVEPGNYQPGDRDAANDKITGKQGGFDVPDLLNGLKKTVGTLTELPSWIPSADALMPKDVVQKAASDLPAGDQTKGAGVADKLIKRIGDSPNPIGELSAALKNMENLQAAEVTRRIDGKHQVNMHFDHATTLPPINANIRGFRPGPTQVAENVSFILSHCPNGIQIEDMQGFSGSVKRFRERKSWNNGMTIGRDEKGVLFVDVDSSVQGPFRVRPSNNRFYEANFPEGSPIRHLMKNPDVLGEVAGALRMFQSTDDVQQITYKKTGQGTAEAAIQANEVKQIPVNQKLDKYGITIKSIDLDKSLSASISRDDKGIRLSNLQGMSVNVSGLFGDQKVTPRKVGLETNAQGVAVVHIEVEHPILKGTMLPIDVPVSQLQEYRKKR